jgi:mercuric ion transport protein
MQDAASTRFLRAGAIASAVAASICCIGPLVLALLGLGGGALLLRFEPYRPFFLVATGLLLGGAFYVMYRRPRAEECEPGSACARPTSRKGQKLVLWIVTVVVVLAAAFPYFSRFVF